MWQQTHIFVKAVGIAAYVYFLYVNTCMVFFVGSVNCLLRPGIVDGVAPEALTLPRQCLDPSPQDDGHGATPAATLLWNASLILAFAVQQCRLQHNVMARKSFKEMVNRVLPPGMERSLFVLCATALLHILGHSWRPCQRVLWKVPARLSPVVWASYMLGWSVAMASTFLIDHFELLGISTSMGKVPEPNFVVRSFYHLVRHPLYLGFITAFWSTPVMTVGRLLFASLTTAWIVVSIHAFEEPDLQRTLGEPYHRYQKEVPPLCPFWPMPGDQNAQAVATGGNGDGESKGARKTE